MSYVEKNLLKGEQVIANAKISWLGIIPSCVWAFLILFVAWALVAGGAWFFSIFIALIGVAVLAQAILTVLLTELSLTNKKLIGKVGVLSTVTLDAPLNKINNIEVTKGLFGMIFRYGKVKITTSSGAFVFDMISNPEAFKNTVMQQIDSAEEQRIMEQAERIASTIK